MSFSIAGILIGAILGYIISIYNRGVINYKLNSKLKAAQEWVLFKFKMEK